MPKTADIDPEAEARRVAAPAIESILRDYRAIERRAEAIADRQSIRYRWLAGCSREIAESYLRHADRYGWSLPRAKRAELEAKAARKAEPLTSDTGRERRVIVQRERNIARKLDRVEREHGPTVRDGVQVAALLDYTEDF